METNPSSNETQKKGTYSEKVDFQEIINKIGTSDFELIDLIQKNPVSKLKMMHSQKLNIENSGIYFDTNHIQALKNDKNQAIYIIPVYYNNNNPDSNLYSISININENFIDTKLTTQVINDDGSINFRSENFEYSNSKSKTAKINNLECYCTVSISECSCHTTHASGGCDHPNIAVSCTSCTSSASISTSPNSEIIPNPYSSVINTVWSNNSNYGYSYGLTGNTIYIALNKKFKPNYNFSSLQKFNIINNSGISGTLLEFLNRERVLNRKATEQTGNSIAQGTPNEQTPMGQPCN